MDKLCFCLEVKGADLAGFYAGTPESAWNEASELSRQLHIVYKDKPFHTVLSCPRPARLGRRKPAEMSQPGQFVVMGVSGCGKSSVASMLALKTGGLFLDADDFHPPENKAKMATGTPLNDEDREPWLDALNRELKDQAKQSRTVFLACSALRQVYRTRLSAGLSHLRFIYLRGSPELIRDRLQNREDHFMPPALLASQFALLEEPAHAIVASIDAPLAAIIDQVLSEITSAHGN